MKEKDFKTAIFSDKRTVYSFKDIAFLLNNSAFVKLKQKINYYVRCGVIKNIRRGIYVKDNYQLEELGGKIFVPSYISLEYVLQKAGVIFQYSEALTMVSYLSRTIQVDKNTLKFRKIKNDVLLNTEGISRNKQGLNIATAERAFLDLLYLNKQFPFDNPDILNRELINKIVPIYNSYQLGIKVKKVLN